MENLICEIPFEAKGNLTVNKLQIVTAVSMRIGRPLTAEEANKVWDNIQQEKQWKLTIPLQLDFAEFLNDNIQSVADSLIKSHYFKKPLKFYIVDLNGHHKNIESIRQMLKNNNIEYTSHNDLSEIDESYTVAYCNNRCFPPEMFPNGCKVIFGPQFFIFPNDFNHPIHKYTYDPNFFFYNTLCDWCENICKSFAPNLTLKYIKCPFGLDIDNITIVPKQRSKIMIYFKGRHPSLFEHVHKLAIEKGIHCTLVIYNNYKEIDFKNALQETKFVIWIGTHESQGFALQETLASNVPILLWDVKSMYEEWNNGWCYAPYKSSGFSLSATSASIWSDECGIKIYDASELESAYNEMNARLDSFTPRKYIEEKNSLNVAFENLEKCLDI
jgi:hypothetical protein